MGVESGARIAREMFPAGDYPMVLQAGGRDQRQFTDEVRSASERSIADAAGPALASMSVYLLMALVLALRPQGLFPARHG